ncbi:MAG: SLC13 family permease, partial [Firmicutes bacterium]|nr:SLC13 family permease [Bacillota bacterium]
GVVTWRQALHAVDWNTLLLLVGMMTLVGLLGEAGFFVDLGNLMRRWIQASPKRLLFVMYTVTAVASAFLDNVTTVLLLSPALFQIAEAMSLDPVPLLMVMVVASNLGGMATLIGDPPNILIGTAAHLSFNQFINLLLPGAVIVLAGIAWVLPRLVRHSTGKGTQLPQIAPSPVSYPLRSRLFGLLGILAITLVAFLLQRTLRLEAGEIAMGGAALAVIYSGPRITALPKFVDWGTLGFFVGVFVIVGALEQHGVAQALAELINGHSWGPWLPVVLFSAAAVFSALLDNVPLVAAAIPVIRALMLQNPHFGNGLWVALAMGAAIGGNATIIGASANVVAQGMALERGYHLDFKRYLKFGLPVFLVTAVLGAGYIFVRF